MREKNLRKNLEKRDKVCKFAAKMAKSRFGAELTDGSICKKMLFPLEIHSPWHDIRPLAIVVSSHLCSIITGAASQKRK